MLARQTGQQVAGSEPHDGGMTTTPITRLLAIYAPDDPRTLFGRAADLAGSVIDGVSPEQLGDPTPCEAFDVHALLRHFMAVLERVELIGRGTDPMSGHAGNEEAPGGDWSAYWDALAVTVEAAWSDDAALWRDVRLPWAQLSGAGALRAYTNEVTVHTWDLARATGQHPDWDAEVVEVSFEVIREHLPVEGRMAQFEAVLRSLPPQQRSIPPAFREAVAVAGDAPTIERLVAWTGRDPAW
jgi:uncharacterized protein (TIGR03086 family)